MSLQSLVLRHAGMEQRVYFAAVDAVPSDEFLSERERARSREYQFAAKKQAFLLGRLAAKSALGALLGEPDLRRIEIGAGAFGQPVVLHPEAGLAAVTVSHSHGLAVALAFPAGHAMGVDLETVSAVSAGTIIGELQASSAEQAWLAAGGVNDATACGVLWTAREALGKSLRIGLNCPLGILALAEINARGKDSWLGHYLNFPQCQCLVQINGDRVLSIAMAREAELNSWPILE